MIFGYLILMLCGCLGVCVLHTIKRPKGINLLLLAANVFFLVMPRRKRRQNVWFGDWCHICLSWCSVLWNIFPPTPLLFLTLLLSPMISLLLVLIFPCLIARPSSPMFILHKYRPRGGPLLPTDPNTSPPPSPSDASGASVHSPSRTYNNSPAHASIRVRHFGPARSHRAKQRECMLEGLFC